VHQLSGTEKAFSRVNMDANEFVIDPFRMEESQVHPQEEQLETRMHAFQEGQELIITMLQRMQGHQEEHHAIAATRNDVTSEGGLVRQHSEEQFETMRKTVEELHSYLAAYSARRQLTIYSSIMLLLACVLLMTIVIRGPLVVRSPFPELAIIVSLAFMFMARLAPQYKK
jgi:hypothetical protein